MKSFNMIKRQFLIIFGMIVRSKFSLAAGVFAGLAMLAMISAPAGAVSFTASGGNLAASAAFVIDEGGNLQVTLTNTSAFDVLVPADVLTAVFFDINGVGPLTPVSALLDGSTVWFGPDGGGNVGGEWAYASGLLGAPHGATEGISSSGLGLFGAANFNGANLQDPAALDGLQYGITSAGDNPLTGNKAVTAPGKNALIHNSVVFTLGGLPSGFDPSASVTNVSFQYGTSLTEPNLRVPEPGTLMLLGSGLIGVCLYRWRRKKG